MEIKNLDEASDSGSTPPPHAALAVPSLQAQTDAVIEEADWPLSEYPQYVSATVDLPEGMNIDALMSALGGSVESTFCSHPLAWKVRFNNGDYGFLSDDAQSHIMVYSSRYNPNGAHKSNRDVTFEAFLCAIRQKVSGAQIVIS